MPSALDNLNEQQKYIVREQVKELLSKTSAYHHLTDAERRKMANSLVNVVAYMADPNAGHQNYLTSTTQSNKPNYSKPLPHTQALALGTDQKIVQEDFTAAAGREGAELFERLTNAVDFPAFVAGLIDGVFNSIVDASIRQMEAYGKLLESVVKSVNEFAQDHFTVNQGRDWLVNRFPTTMQMNVNGGQPRLQLTEQGEERGLDQVKSTLGITEDIDIDDEEGELLLAQKAQLEMARIRQKQLATMVLMGINRIVVTDGLINAKVIIDVRTSDIAQRTNRASSYDSKDARRRSKSNGGWFSSGYDRNDEITKTIVTSATDETSESKAEAKSKLSGEVRVNFRSETFPLEKLASQTQLESVNQVSQSTAA